MGTELTVPMDLTVLIKSVVLCEKTSVVENGILRSHFSSTSDHKVLILSVSVY